MSRKNTARKTCTICNKRPVIGGVRGSIEGDYCLPCYEYAGWENNHTDEGHDDEDYVMPEDTECLVCLDKDPADEEVPAVEPKPATRATGMGTKQTSHAGCSHPATKSGRAKCRAQRAKSAE